MRNTTCWIALTLLSLCGCGSYFAPDINLDKTLTNSDVVGEWELTPASLEHFTRTGFNAQPEHRFRMVFHADGTCRHESVIVQTNSKYCEANGTWVLEHDTQGGSNIQTKNALRLELHIGNTRRIEYFNFTEREGVIYLWNHFGDPDAWEFIEYKLKQ